MYEKMGNANFKHIGWEEMELIAKAVICSTEYVNLILKGERKKKSVTAKKIFRAAKAMNEGIEKAKNKSIQELIIDDNN